MMINLTGQEVCAIEEALDRAINHYNTSTRHKHFQRRVLIKLEKLIAPHAKSEGGPK